MNSQTLNEDTACRLAKALILKHGISYPAARKMLSELELTLVCSEDVRRSASLQAALLTAVNTGKRAFHGGVRVAMPPGVQCLVPWPTASTLNEIVACMGAVYGKPDNSARSQSLYFGRATSPLPDSLQVVCTGWRGGVTPAEQPVELTANSDFSLGGVLAGALGVAKGFLRVSGLSPRPVLESPAATAHTPLSSETAETVAFKVYEHQGKYYPRG